MMRLVVLIVALGLIVGMAAAIIARKKGKDPALWFLVGAVFGLFAVLGYGLYVLQEQKVATRGK